MRSWDGLERELVNLFGNRAGFMHERMATGEVEQDARAGIGTMDARQAWGALVAHATKWKEWSDGSDERYEEALVAVSKGFLGKFEMACEDDIKQNVMTTMGMCHAHTTEVCLEYFEKMRRQVYQTPKFKTQLLHRRAYQICFKTHQNALFQTQLKTRMQRSEFRNAGFVKRGF